MKFGLRGIRTLSAELGNPHRAYPSIHIAGSNGKGSTAAMLAAILQSAGYKTGLYTSPHLIDYRERIRINGKLISQKDVVRITERLRPSIRRMGATFFEAATALAFKYFAEEEVDIAVIETGLGGRLDATNIISPLITVITTISHEHTKILGNTLSEIAFEKSGIIKSKVPCVTGVKSKTALEVIRSTCKRKRSPFIILEDPLIQEKERSIDRTVIDISVNGRKFDNLIISMAGSFQERNAALVILTAHQITNGKNFDISEGHLRRGLGNVQQLTGIHCRLSVIGKDPMIIADVAHNPESIKRQVEALRSLGIADVVLIFGAMKDKNVREMSKRLLPISRYVILVSPNTERSRPAVDLAKYFKSGEVDPIIAGSVPEGIRRAKEISKGARGILITGSHFVVGEALAYLQKRKYLTINQ